MSPPNPHVNAQLRQLIYYNLDCNLLRNALFLAGRLHAYEPRSSEAACLLALCHLRLGQLKAAYDASRSSGSRGTHLGCTYVFAQACLGLERYGDGITALERNKSVWMARNSWNKHTETKRQHLPDAAAVYCLQGKLWQAHNDTNKAIECYAESLKLNPFMWDAFLGLCDLGVNVRVPNIFKMTPEMMNGVTGSFNEETPLGILDESPPSVSSGLFNNQPPQANDPFSISKNRINGESRVNLGSSALFEKLNGSTSLATPIGNTGGLDFNDLETPTVPGVVAATTMWQNPSTTAAETTAVEPPIAAPKKMRTLQGLGMDFSMDAPKMKSSTFKSRIRTETDDSDVTTVHGTSTSFSGIMDRKRTISGQVAPSKPTSSAAQMISDVQDPGAPQRRSVRLFNQIRPQSSKFSSSTGSIGSKEGRELRKAKATGTKGRTAHGSTVGRVVSGNRKHGDSSEMDGKDIRPNTSIYSSSTLPITHPKPAVNDKVKEYESLQWLLDLFTKLGSGYFALSHYQCQDALQIFNSITPSQKETPWVLAQIGRALFEQASYADAEKYFARIKMIAPSRLDDMELYSTVLWHLKSEIDLAFLAHEIIDIDRQSPQAWCAIGNSFSLQRDHDQALKCFKRATQLDPKFAYAFTLQGHEHIANEEYDKALAAYRSSIAAESRHYNAWYGLGRVFEKQGKHDVAEQHYRTAASINPTNAVLVCCIGVVLEKMKNPKAALLQYTRSCDLAPKSALSRFKKARVLMALQEPHMALAELKVLKDIAPDEANVHFLLGRVYKILRQKANAIKHFTTALNLDPKASHYIKEAMEQMEEEDDEDGLMTQ
ncbi:anaphase-promoting complex subunit cdc27 [Bachmanniomyces sp. S44760]|nr:anaphase-promoting complex subunit cdc27 [Bachmanniomyces sp. S44760]